MSTKIECTTCKDATIGLDDANPNRVDREFYIFMGEEGHYVLRADFLAAVETECGVRIVPADAIVIDRAELPVVTMSISNGVYVRATFDARRRALELLAVAEFADAHPSSDEAQVRAVNDLLTSYVARWGRNDNDLARQLVAWGVRVDLP